MKFDPCSDFSGLIIKSWEDGENSYFEGWLSTPRKDLEKDVTEPEAFIPSAESYFARRAPLSVQHGTQYIPSGHLQKAAIVRDGAVLKEFAHPTDAAEFEHFPASGSGVWVRGVANEAMGRDSLRKGNLGGMSFIANASKKEPLPGGRWRYTEFGEWMESTLAAYPINTDAVIAVVKAFGIQPEPQTEETPTMSQIEEMIQKALADRETEKANKVAAEQAAQANETVTKAGLGAMFLELKENIMGEIQKSFSPAQNPAPDRGQGVGRRGVVAQSPESERDADPAGYLVRKAQSGAELDDVDQELISKLTVMALTEGLV